MRILAANNTPTSYTKSYNRYNVTHSAGKQQINTICFKGQDFLDLSEYEILKRIKESISPENFVGHGTEAEVYRIKDTEYCVRIPYPASDLFGMDFTKKLSPSDKVNHIVAKLGFGASIMKYFSGHTPKEHQHNELYRNQLQEKIAEMPVKSYTGLLHQIADAVNNEMIYDFSGGNLIVNTENNELTAIDFYLLDENCRKVRPLSEMYSVLTCYGTKNNIGKKIFDKVMLAGLEEFKPDKIPCMDIALFDFVDLCNKRKKIYIPKFDILMLKIEAAVEKLKNVKKAEIMDKSLAKSLSEHIRHLRRLMMRIH